MCPCNAPIYKSKFVKPVITSLYGSVESCSVFIVPERPFRGWRSIIHVQDTRHRIRSRQALESWALRHFSRIQKPLIHRKIDHNIGVYRLCRYIGREGREGWSFNHIRLLFAKDSHFVADENDSDCSSSMPFARKVADVVDCHCLMGKQARCC